jgi:hypothetical protein
MKIIKKIILFFKILIKFIKLNYRLYNDGKIYKIQFLKIIKIKLKTFIGLFLSPLEEDKEKYFNDMDKIAAWAIKEYVENNWDISNKNEM